VQDAWREKLLGARMKWSGTVRTLTLNDALDVAKLLVGVSEFMVNESVPDAWCLEDLERWLEAEGNLCTGAFEGSELIGFCLAHLHLATRKLHIENLYVAKPYRRRRVAESLLCTTVQQTHESVHDRIRVVAMVKRSNTEAEKFFMHVGLTKGETMSWFQLNSHCSEG